MIIQEENTVVFCSEHDQVWRNSNGEYHRLGGPSVVFSSGSQYWYYKGRCHRTGGPSVIYSDGTQYWYHKGRCYRTGGPSVIK